MFPRKTGLLDPGSEIGRGSNTVLAAPQEQPIGSLLRGRAGPLARNTQLWARRTHSVFRTRNSVQELRDGIEKRSCLSK